MRGSYGQDEASIISMMVEKCNENSAVECKSDEEIFKYFANKTIFFLHNEIRFDSVKYGQDAIVQESRYEYITMGNWKAK